MDHKIREGALFALGDNQPNTLDSHVTALPATRDTNKTIPILTAIFDLCGRDPDAMTDMASMQEQLNLTRSSIVRQMKKLVDLGLVEKTAINLNDGKRQRTLYTLTQPKRSMARLDTTENQDLETRQRELDPLSTLSFHRELQDRMSWHGEWLSIFGLVAGFRIAKSGKNTEGIMEIPIKMGKEQLTLTLRSTAGMKFLGVLDLRVLMVLISLIIDAQDSHKSINNPFQIATRDLCNALGIEASGGNKRWVVQVLDRISGTELTVSRITPGLLEKYQGLLGIDKKFRLINGTITVSTEQSRGVMVPEVMSIELDRNLFERICDPERRYQLVVHPDMRKESDPFAIKMHLWCRRAIAHKPDHMIKHAWFYTYLWEELMPAPIGTYKAFQVAMDRFLAKHHKRALGHSVYLGYTFRKTGENAVWIKINPKDPIHQRYFAMQVKNPKLDKITKPALDTLG